MQRANLSPFVGPAFKALKEHGCSGVRGFQPRRVHAGFDDTAWSKPCITVYGCGLEIAERTLRAMGWAGDVKAER